MQRRHFLARLAGASGLALATKALPVLAGEEMKGMHGMDMSNMGMNGMHKMRAMQAEAAPGARLAAVTGIPAGRPFTGPAPLRNEAAEPGKFKATLVAAPTRVELIPGVPTQAWTYNGLLPGPLIELRAGDDVEITLKNQLDQPTTIHWHGLPVPPDQDGNPGNAVGPGTSRVYRFKLPETTEGLYWYHPHPHGLSAEQVYRGLAGPIVIRRKDDPLAAVPERILAITDLRLMADGVIPPSGMMDNMNGREGQFALVNGQNRPALAFDAGGRERWRILNATNARYLRLTLPGHTFTLVGTDGGLIERPRPGPREILVAPAQRVDVLVTAAGRHAARLMAAPYDRGKMGGTGPTPSATLLDVDFSDVRRGARTPVPSRLREFPALPAPTARKRVVMSESMDMGAMTMGMTGMGMMGMGGMPGTHAPAPGNHSAMQFLLNGKTFDMHRTDLTSKAGAWEDWEIVNDSDMDHPFHVHGTQFTVLERASGGRTHQAPFRAWHDTVNVKPRETVRIRIMQPMAGIRMYHCHILEHEDLGMMGRLDVT